MRCTKWMLVLGIWMALWGGFPGSAVLLAQQDDVLALFRKVEQAQSQAAEIQAGLLAPKSFGEAEKLHREAKAAYQRGKKLQDIRKKLRSALKLYETSMKATEQARLTLATAIKARSDAQIAGAQDDAPEKWKRAEERFKEAAIKLENRNLKSAESKADEAERIYREAELIAIKATYLEETRQLLAEADRADVKDRAPKTLAKARSLVQQAEEELENNRYDRDRARSLAQQAKYEARHALYLSRIIKEMKKKKSSMEDLFLMTEEPLKLIAANIDLVAEFDQGFDYVAAQIIQYIQNSQDETERLKQSLADRDQQVVDLEARVSELEDQLGGIAQEQSALKERMEAQRRIREKFAAIEKMFDRSQARVLREGNNVIIRMVGLNFSVGSAVIEPKYFSLLTTVQKAIKIFENCTLTIEGHTDSYGGDQQNLRLSQKRAEAVREYLLANMNLTPEQIEAVGYGESHPIANNETREGRAKNRRIDVVIHPHISGLE